MLLEKSFVYSLEVTAILELTLLSLRMGVVLTVLFVLCLHY
jgi:hypothetical protein